MKSKAKKSKKTIKAWGVAWKHYNGYDKEILGMEYDEPEFARPWIYKTRKKAKSKVDGDDDLHVVRVEITVTNV